MRRLLFIGSRCFEIEPASAERATRGAAPRIDRQRALSLIRRLIQDPSNRATLSRLAAEARFGLPVERLDDDALAEQLGSLLSTGRALLREGPRAPDLTGIDGYVEDEQPTAPASARAPKTALTWIEILLVGEDGEPIAGEKYRIDLPNGSTREGRLDDKGLARVDGIDPGECVVTFPSLDEEAWARA